MKVIRFILLFIITILFIAFVTVLPYCVAVKDTLLKKEFMVDGLMEAGIADEIKSTMDKETDDFLDQFEAEMKNQIKQNVDKKVPQGVNVSQYVETPEVNNTIQTAKKDVSGLLKEFNSKKNVENVMNIVVKTLYEEKEISFEEENINKELKNLVDDIVTNNNIKLSDEASAQMNSFIDELSVELNKEIVSNLKNVPLTNGKGDVIVNPLPLAISAVNWACMALLAIIIILFIIILSLNHNKIYNGFLQSAIWIAISGIVIKIGNILVSSVLLDEVHRAGKDGIVRFIENTIEKIMDATNGFFIAYIIIAIILCLTSILLRLLLKRKNNTTMESPQ